jgi:hypothetical protein
MTIADDIVDLVERKQRRPQPLHLTEEDIAEMLFGQDKAYQQRVNQDCRFLVDQGRLVRHGSGGPSDPFTYSLPPINRRI